MRALQSELARRILQDPQSRRQLMEAVRTRDTSLPIDTTDEAGRPMRVFAAHTPSALIRKPAR